jgi:hypothetical protein
MTEELSRAEQRRKIHVDGDNDRSLHCGDYRDPRPWYVQFPSLRVILAVEAPCQGCISGHIATMYAREDISGFEDDWMEGGDEMG